MSILDQVKGRDKNVRQMPGVVAGIVTNNQDPDDLGRVKVKFPWLSDSNESSWARITTFMAGGKRGGYFIPEVGDEVLVAFEHGDINHPYVIGFLWNGVDKPPESNSNGKNNIRQIKSRSGHVITLNDEQSREQVLIRSNAGHSITLDDSSGQERIEIKDKSGSNKVVIDSAQNSIEITSSMQLKIKANVIEISADSTMTIKAGATLTLQGALVKIN